MTVSNKDRRRQVEEAGFAVGTRRETDDAYWTIRIGDHTVVVFGLQPADPIADVDQLGIHNAHLHGDTRSEAVDVDADAAAAFVVTVGHGTDDRLVLTVIVLVHEEAREGMVLGVERRGVEQPNPEHLLALERR